MKKRVLWTLMAIVLLFSGCSGQNVSEIDLADAAKTVMDENLFTDDMNLAKTDVLLALYDLTQNEVAQVVGYVGSGATAEELTLWKAVNDEAASVIAGRVQARIENQITSFRDYNPEEVPKLESAVVLQNGNFVALCICSDNSAAEELLKSYFES